MRWFWVDRIVEFQSGQRAVATKNVSLGEEHLHDHFAGYPIMPGSLVIEGLAQTGGILVSEHHNFKKRVALAKLGKVTFHFPVEPGDTLTYTAEIRDVSEDGAIVQATSHRGSDMHAEAEIIYAYFSDPRIKGQVFEPHELIALMRVYKLFDVGIDREGKPLQPSPELLAAERTALAAPTV